MSDETLYQNPLVTRYGSPAMASLFSEHHKALLWRKLWTELARAEHDLGLPITDAQIRELEAGQTTIDFSRIRLYDQQFRHEMYVPWRSLSCIGAPPVVISVIMRILLSCAMLCNSSK